MELARVAVAAAVSVGMVVLGSCTPGKGGAVVARWRLIDSVNGMPASGCQVKDVGELIDAFVDQIRMHVVPIGDGGPGDEVGCPSCTFSCDPLEYTTQFEIPEGDYRFSLEALRCGTAVGDSPPPVVRSVHRGEITNLSAIGISIRPCTHTPSSGAVCPDPSTSFAPRCDGGA